MSKRTKDHDEPMLPFRPGRGGARRGAGRKPKGARAGVQHRPRARRSGREPMHVTMKLLRGLPPLRTRVAVRILWRCFARGRDRFGFRLVQFSIQRDHLHLIAEAPDRRSLARGMQGLAVRVAKNLNKGWSRQGTVFADRYHDRVLRTPREVRAVLCYVLNNARHHGHWRHAIEPDPLSSSWWFDGFRTPSSQPPPSGPPPVVAARTWLLRTGWRRHGLIDPTTIPGTAQSA